jgi:hypothetical protein
MARVGHTYLRERGRIKEAGPPMVATSDPRRRVDPDSRGDRRGEGQ